MKRILWALFFVLAAPAYGGTITWTNPIMNQMLIDSTDVDCSNGTLLNDLDHVEIWGYPVAGGGWRWLKDIPETNREGLQDSTDVVDGQHIYMYAVDHSMNHSCISDVICVNCLISGVGDDPFKNDVPVSVQYFDVQGRLVDPEASGVYFKRTIYKSGFIKVEKYPLVK
jgi:hypothetical protein